MTPADSFRGSKVLILDFGSQYTQVIARRVRECQVYSQVVRFDTPAAELAREEARGIILSGGPASVYAPRAPQPDPAIFGLGLPILGICYGLQLMGYHLGGRVVGGERREFGAGRLEVLDPESPLLRGLPSHLEVWNSHGDRLAALPAGFRSVARTENSEHAVIEDRVRHLYGLQFHPEVVHTPRGQAVIENFLYAVCGCRPDWTMGSFVDQACRQIRAQVGDEKVILGLSGGVDSSVAAVLLHRAIGDQLTCIFVDNGLLRAHEAETVQRLFGEHFHVPLKFVDASEPFLRRLRGVTDPERKRKIIGAEFIRVFERATRELRAAATLETFLPEGGGSGPAGGDTTDSGPLAAPADPEPAPAAAGDAVPVANAAAAPTPALVAAGPRPAGRTRKPPRARYRFLAQGTLYPDVIESVSISGNPAALIKSHHNVGGLPEKMRFSLIEPLRQLFKDEVRKVGLELGLPKEIVQRQPFPGPGLAVRIAGEVTPERLRIVREADTIVVGEMKAADWYYRVWQSFAVLLPVRSVGVMGDERTYDSTVVIRVVESQDGMTADWVRLPYELLGRIANRITNEVKGVNRVCYDVSSKPPSTIEWE